MNRLAFEATQSKEPCYVLKLKGKKKKRREPISAQLHAAVRLILTITRKVLSSDWLNMSHDIPGSILFSCASEFT